MLRISVLNAEMTRLKLEGKLAHEWVREPEKAWEAIAAMIGTAEMVVDRLDVTFVDDAGRELLDVMRRAGAELVGSGPLVSALLDEIEDAELANSAEVPQKEEIEQ
jgi:hypothetical protein